METPKSYTAGLVVLLFVDKENKCRAKVLGMSDKFRHCVPSCSNSPDHENRLDLDTFAAGFKISMKGGAVEYLLSEVGKLQ